MQGALGAPPMVKAELVELADVERAISVLRGHRVLLDADLAAMYGVQVRALNQAVRRNKERFPEDFMFQLTEHETTSLRSHTVILEDGRGRHEASSEPMGVARGAGGSGRSRRCCTGRGG